MAGRFSVYHLCPSPLKLKVGQHEKNHNSANVWLALEEAMPFS